MDKRDRKQNAGHPSSTTEDQGRQNGIITDMTKQSTENLVFHEHTMEEICHNDNIKEALKKVVQNKGKPGIDGLRTDELEGFFQEHWPEIRDQMLTGQYKFSPVRRVTIPKPKGGVRQLGIPTVKDRVIQQAILQVLQNKWDPTFSENSYGFRPGRSAYQAVESAQKNIEEGYDIIVDIDLEKFFDKVNHDILMGRIAKRVRDKRVLRIIRQLLNSGAAKGEQGKTRQEGMPQGGPLSPLLSNIILDELDKELEQRKLRFCRYADDFMIFVRSPRAGHRVMRSIEQFLQRKLKLRINQDKSAVAKATERSFLGFSFIKKKKKKKRVNP